MDFNSIFNREKEIQANRNKGSEKYLSEDKSSQVKEPVENINLVDSQYNEPETKSLEQKLVDSLVAERDEIKSKYTKLVESLDLHTEAQDELNDKCFEILEAWRECQKIYDEGLQSIVEVRTKYQSLCDEMEELKKEYKKKMDKLLKDAKHELRH
jgi:chromosome segregation ATPase